MIRTYATRPGQHRHLTTPVQIEAVALDEASDADIDALMAGKSWARDDSGINWRQGGGQLRCWAGMWLMKVTSGDVYSISADDFAAGFGEVE